MIAGRACTASSRHDRPRGSRVTIGLAGLALLGVLAPAAAGAAPASGPPLAIGLTENDPRLLMGDSPIWRAAVKVVALKPAYIRVLIPGSASSRAPAASPTGTRRSAAARSSSRAVAASAGCAGC